jgi:hypothetical protein
MTTSSYVEGLLDDLEELAGIAPEQEAIAAAARRLGRALEASASARLLEIFSEVALALTAQLPEGHVEVRLIDREPELVYVEDETRPGPHVAPEDPSTARITLRVPQRLKQAIEGAAAREGLSANTWLIKTIDRAVTGIRPRQGNRLKGFARG